MSLWVELIIIMTHDVFDGGAFPGYPPNVVVCIAGLYYFVNCSC